MSHAASKIFFPTEPVPSRWVFSKYSFKGPNTNYTLENQAGVGRKLMSFSDEPKNQHMFLPSNSMRMMLLVVVVMSMMIIIRTPSNPLPACL